MIRDSDVLVTVERGIASVKVRRSNLIAEVRDYDIEGTGENHPLLWTDENGKRCTREYFTEAGGGPIGTRVAKDLERFAADLRNLTKLRTAVSRSRLDDGLHTIQIEGVDFYFNVDGTGYDGWGMALREGGDRPK